MYMFYWLLSLENENHEFEDIANPGWDKILSSFKLLSEQKLQSLTLFASHDNRKGQLYLEAQQGEKVLVMFSEFSENDEVGTHWELKESSNSQVKMSFAEKVLKKFFDERKLDRNLEWQRIN